MSKKEARKTVKRLQRTFKVSDNLGTADIQVLFQYIGDLEAAAGQAKEALRKNLVCYAHKDEPVMLAAFEKIEALGI